MSELSTKAIQILKQHIDLILQRAYLSRQVSELLRFLEASAAIRRIYAFEVEISASLAGRLAIAFDLATLTFIATVMSARLDVLGKDGSAGTDHAREMYRDLFDLPVEDWSSSGLRLALGGES